MIADKKGDAMGDLGFGGLGDLSDMLETAESTGGPTEFDIASIDEDPDQPRKTFDEESLKELASNIKGRGVKTPISVRTHPDDPARHIINHGARRFRASILAGKNTIPGFIDEDYNKADQVVENLQRDSLTPREIAEFVGEEVKKGVKKGDIAKALGKSNSYISQHYVLLDLPHVVADVFYTGRCEDVTVINELAKLTKKDKVSVEQWLSDPDQELTRGSIKLLKAWIEEQTEAKKKPGIVFSQEENQPSSPRDPQTVDVFEGVADADKVSEGGDPEPEQKPAKPAKVSADQEPEQKPANPKHTSKGVVRIIYKQRLGNLLIDRLPEMDGFGWISLDDGGEEEVDLGELQLVSVIPD